MQTPESASRYDAIVIGAGQAGGPLAGALARAGRRTALIERAHVGGTCINVGCTPTKTMVASARVAALARRAGHYGVHVAEPAVDMPAVRERKRAMVESFRAGSERRLAAATGLDLLRGAARFTGPKTVAVTFPDGATRELAAETIVVNAGGRPAPLAVPGLAASDALDSTSIMELDVVPSHLVVLGGGYVGLEFAQMFRRFGARVTIVQRGGRLLTREDADVAEAVRVLLVEDGIDVRLDASIERGERRPDGSLRLAVAGPGGSATLEASHLLGAVGRVPNTDALGTAAAGVALDERGYIRVNDRLETNVPGLYAVGDVNGGYAFTHVAYDDFRILRANLLQGGGATRADRLVPYTVFTDPQLGRVGLSEEDARAKGLDVVVCKLPMTQVARALEVGEFRGFMKAVVDRRSQLILGVAVLGLEGGELMAMLQLAMLGGITAGSLRDAVFAHPTLAESLNNLFAQV